MTVRRRDSLALALKSEVRIEILKHLGKQGRGKMIDAREVAETHDLKFADGSYHIERLHEYGAVKLAETGPGEDPLIRRYLFDIDEPWALGVLGLTEPGTTSSGQADGNPS